MQEYVLPMGGMKINNYLFNPILAGVFGSGARFLIFVGTAEAIIGITHKKFKTFGLIFS